MASERQRTKGLIRDTQADDPELEEALAFAVRRNLEITQENNRHKEALQSQELVSKELLQSQELGSVGKWLGGQNQSASNAATVIAVLALGAVLVCVVAMVVHPQSADAFERPLTICAGLVTTALAYLFGARSNRPK